jgi:hypothetical protein
LASWQVRRAPLAPTLRIFRSGRQRGVAGGNGAARATGLGRGKTLSPMIARRCAARGKFHRARAPGPISPEPPPSRSSSLARSRRASVEQVRQDVLGPGDPPRAGLRGQQLHAEVGPLPPHRDRAGGRPDLDVAAPHRAADLLSAGWDLARGTDAAALAPRLSGAEPTRMPAASPIWRLGPTTSPPTRWPPGCRAVPRRLSTTPYTDTTSPSAVRNIDPMLAHLSASLKPAFVKKIPTPASASPPARHTSAPKTRRAVPIRPSCPSPEIQSQKSANWPASTAPRVIARDR